MNDNQVKHLELPFFFKPFECKKLIRIGKMYDGGYQLDEESLKKTVEWTLDNQKWLY